MIIKSVFGSIAITRLYVLSVRAMETVGFDPSSTHLGLLKTHLNIAEYLFEEMMSSLWKAFIIKTN